MRVRLASVVLIVVIGAAACSPSPFGPTAPVAPDQLSSDDAIKAAGARAAAAAFVRAYASETDANPRALARLVDGARLERWVYWLGIQDREFPGTITGAVDNSQIGPAAPFDVATVPGSAAFLRDVDVSATVTFSFLPDEGELITLSRTLDGPMRLLFDGQRGTWSVLDFTRDGIPLSRSFEIVPKRTVVSRSGTDVAMDAFVSVPYWQFFLRISSDRDIGLAPQDVRLVGAQGARVASARDVTASIRSVASGDDVEGIVTFPAQATADGLTLRMTLRGPGGPATVAFVLQGLIDPIPSATASPTPSP
jgi:hypothetical protein